MKEIIKNIESKIESRTRQKVLGRDALVKDLFKYLLSRIDLDHHILMLCTSKGMIVLCDSSEINVDISGYTMNRDFLVSHQEDVTYNSSLEGYVLVFAVPKEEETKVNRLLSNLKMLLGIFEANKEKEQYLLSCLDSIDSAICIYDKDAYLLHGNKKYFENMQIFDKNEVIGMNILDITKKSGIKIRASKNGSNNLKMLDVLRNGNRILDWEVMIESETSPNKASFVSNNMYPVKNKSGKVAGMIEVSHSHQVSLNKTKKLMGLIAEYNFDSIIGKSPEIKEVVEQAKSYSDSDYSLLILGESGVGKELFAQSIHNYSQRCEGPFVAINCASFPESLIESELFGYVGGAFTGASKNGQVGKFELADGGTLFLDEIGELPFHFQSKLLRVLETWKVNRIGSTKPTPVNVRVVAATNRDLKKMIEEGVFREDLYYRLQVLSIEVPPLRDRSGDLLLLADSFLKQIAAMENKKPKVLSKEAKKSLLEYEWPGNVRELRNAMQRVSLLNKAQNISKEALETAVYSSGYAMKSSTEVSSEKRIEEKLSSVKSSYKELINEAIEIAGGNKSQAAELIGVSRKTFYRMMDKYL